MGAPEPGKRSKATPAPPLGPQEVQLRNRSLLLGVLLPVLLTVCFADAGETVMFVARFAFWLVLPVYVVIRTFYRWVTLEGSLLRCVLDGVRIGLPFAPTGTPDASTRLPLATLGLIVLNVGVFCSVDQDSLALQYCEPSTWVRSNWTSMFAHADIGHLTGNMIFLWAFGSALESRIGSGRLLLDYLALGTVANAVALVAYLSEGCDSGLGASGAISGIMGISLVRCYFRRIAIGIPMLGPWFGSPLLFTVEVNSVVVLTYYLLWDLLGARAQLDGSASHIGHWAHLGGYFGGLWIGYRRRYYREGLREGLEDRMTRGPKDGDFGARRRARAALLDLSPDHPDALLSRARDASRFQRRKEGARDYVRVIEILMRSDLHRAAEIFVEYYQKYMQPLPLDEQLVLTPRLVALGSADVAARCLEIAAGKPGVTPDLRTRALAFEAKLLSHLGLEEAAESRRRLLRP